MTIKLLISLCVLPSLLLASNDVAQERKKSENKLDEKAYRAWQNHVMECDRIVDDAVCSRCMAGSILSGHVNKEEPPAAQEPYVIGAATSPVSMGLLYLQCGDLCRAQASSLQGEQRKKMQRKAFRFYEQSCNVSEGVDESINAEADTRLLDCYLNGDGAKSDYDVGLCIINSLRKKSASAAAAATMRLGQMLCLGLGINNFHMVVGYDLLKKAAKQNDNHAARQLARAYIAAATNAGIMQKKVTDEDYLLHEEILHDKIISAEAKALVDGADAFRRMTKAETLDSVNQARSEIRQLFQRSMPPAARVVILALYYRSELEAVLQVDRLRKEHFKTVDAALEAATTGNEITQALEDAATAQEAWSFKPMTEEEQRKIAHELRAYDSIAIAVNVADIVLGNIKAGNQLD